MNSPDDDGVIDTIPSRPLRKSVSTLAITQASQSYSLTARKIYNVLLFLAQEQPADTYEYSALLKDVVRLIDYSSRNYVALKDALRGMGSTLVEWESPAAGESTKWSMAPLLAGVDLVPINGTMTIVWSYGHNIRREILDPARFAKLSLLSLAKLRTVAALALYEICARYRDNPSKVTAKHPWRWWFEILRVEPGKRAKADPEYKFFKRDVLTPAVAEISALTELDITLVEFRAGRSVADLQFKVEVKEGSAKVDNKRLLEPVDLRLAELAGQLSVSLKDVEKLSDAYGEKAVFEALELLAKRVENQSLPQVNSRARWLGEVVARTVSNEIAARSSREKDADRDEGERSRLVSQQHREANLQKVWELFLSLDAEAQQMHRNNFEAHILFNKSDVFRKNWREQGQAGRIVGPLFKVHLCEELLGKHWDKLPLVEEQL
ncbi:MAG: replication initiation protein [Burkholderiales bacterium]|jgi:hypothetical protein|nr:replication initiation protein [Burkholderiales bacterium]